MESKSLLFGVIGFILGGLVVSLAASAQPSQQKAQETSMDSMTSKLADLNGDEFDREFVAQMVAHHQGAIDMAMLAANQAKHEEIKQLSSTIILTQQNEVTQLKTWQKEWGYAPQPGSATTHSGH